MIKLKELNLSVNNISDLQVPPPTESGTTINYLKNTENYDTYKGYKFFEVVKNNIIYIILATTEPTTVIGFAKIRKDVENTLKIFGDTNISHYTIDKVQINDVSHSNELKTILYDYILKKYTIIKDSTQYNKKIWTDYLPMYTNNSLFSITNPQNVNKNFSSIDSLENISNYDNTNCFLGISNKNIIFDKVFSALNHNFKNYETPENVLWTHSDIGKTETLKSVRNNLVNIAQDSNILDMLKKGTNVKAVIFVGKNYCTLVKLGDNLKIKVVDF